MQQVDRRSFIRTAGTAAAGLASVTHASLSWAAGVGDPDIVVVNAKVYTVDPRQPRAEAFAIRDSRFVAVGTSDAMRALAGPGTKIVDAGQAVIVPGFIDCHNHAGGEVLLYDVIVGNPFEVEFVSIQSIIDKLKARAAKTPPGTWVSGQFYDDTKVTDKRLLTAADLDKVSTEHPVMVRHRGGHTTFYNHKALAMAGITDATSNPPGGTFDKGPDGTLSGRVTDRANAVFAKVGTWPTYSAAERAQRSRDGQAYISKQFARYGLTGVHHQGGDLFALQQVRAQGDLKHRVSYEVWDDAMLNALIASGVQTGFGDEWIRFGATGEHTADGSFSERTMAMSVAYPGLNSSYRGNITETQDDLDRWVERVHRAGIQPNIHANGDVAIDMALKAYERAQRLLPAKNMRPKITHCTLIDDGLLDRIKATGTVPAAFSTYAFYNSDKFVYYGEDLLKRSMAFRSFLDKDIPVCAGSDFSPGPFSPLMGIQAMVTRKGWDGKVWGANQRVTVDEALRINTLNGAFASKEEAIKGSITPGKLADYVVLAKDPHAIDPDTIKDIKILRTVVGGQAMYEA